MSYCFSMFYNIIKFQKRRRSLIFLGTVAHIRRLKIILYFIFEVFDFGEFCYFFIKVSPEIRKEPLLNWNFPLISYLQFNLLYLLISSRFFWYKLLWILVYTSMTTLKFCNELLLLCVTKVVEQIILHILTYNFK